ncbi:hypothetical protein DPMN_071135 [Dreissena polymorpha]|uniref:Uncharacterized protein n=1 Tax=Dreissena polymorpha TaxID=45954 RepID=A0A9D4BPD7_DREPO|nr:hypothetical protein DPMN_071135 [Dreissena polymorpha]
MHASAKTYKGWPRTRFQGPFEELWKKLARKDPARRKKQYTNLMYQAAPMPIKDIIIVEDIKI